MEPSFSSGETMNTQEEVEEYENLVKELQIVEEQIDQLETICLRKSYHGKQGLLTPIDPKQSQNIVVPSSRKMFSLSSCTSNPYQSLTEPHQAFGLELVDGKGRRQAYISRSELPKKTVKK